MSNIKLLGRAAATLVILCCSSAPAWAQATRTWVSGVGDDANPCSRTAPCQTFATAISKTATAGEIDVLDPGGFGAVTITKSITIDGSGGNIAGVLVSGTNGITVAAGTTDVVTLRNLDIDGLNTGLTGIQIQSKGMVRIEHTQIYGFQNGVTDASGGGTLFMKDVAIHENSQGGVNLQPSGPLSAVLNDVRVDNNLSGITALDNVVATMTGGEVSNNTQIGVTVNSSTTASNAATIDLENVLVSQNADGLAVRGNGAGTIRYSNCDLLENGTSLYYNSANGKFISFGNNRVAGGTRVAPSSTMSQN
jgi:hypothetical protein